MLIHRTINSRDINEANHLLYKELFEPLGMPCDSQEKLKVHDGIEHYFICVVNQTIVGVMILVVFNEIIELHHAAVSKKYRGQDIGKKLWQEVLTFCKSEGIKNIELYSRNSAIYFWRSIGFIEIGEWLEAKPFVEHGIKHKKMEIFI